MAILIERDAYLLELARYVVLNPVRARMVVGPQDWPWSSYAATWIPIVMRGAGDGGVAGARGGGVVGWWGGGVI